MADASLDAYKGQQKISKAMLFRCAR